MMSSEGALSSLKKLGVNLENYFILIWEIKNKTPLAITSTSFFLSSKLPQCHKIKNGTKIRKDNHGNTRAMNRRPRQDDHPYYYF